MVWGLRSILRAPKAKQYIEKADCAEVGTSPQREGQMSDVILEVKGISKAFGGVQALDGVNLTIKKGEIHCLAGGNGSGKSTLIKIISGFYKPDSGIICIDGKEYAKLAPIESIMLGIQVIYQDFSIFPNLTVAENIAINDAVASKRKLQNWKTVRRTAKAAMSKLGVDLPLDTKVEELSVADKQIIAISRAIVHDAKLIIMDEPTTALTRKEIEKLFIIIRRLQSQGISILFVSHKLDEVFEIADNFTIFRNGKNVITDSAKNIDNDKFVYYMTGRTLEKTMFTPKEIINDTPLFEVRNLCLDKGFENINLKVYAGEVLGIVGLLGSGRTELAKSIFGILPATAGEMFIEGEKVNIKSPQDAIRHKLGYVPEDRLTEGLFLTQPIESNMMLANIDDLTNKRGVLDEKRIYADTERWKEELSIKMRDASSAISTLSGGNQQKVVLAKWLEIIPKVLVLNGPTVGVDIGAKYDLHNYLHKLAATLKTAIIVISDDIPELIENCNRILVMKKGRIVGEYSNMEVDEHTLLAYVTGQEN